MLHNALNLNCKVFFTLFEELWDNLNILSTTWTVGRDVATIQSRLIKNADCINCFAAITFIADSFHMEGPV